MVYRKIILVLFENQYVHISLAELESVLWMKTNVNSLLLKDGAIKILEITCLITMEKEYFNVYFFLLLSFI